MWLLLLAVHLIGLVGFNLTLRRSLLKKVDPFTLATVMQTGIAIPMAFVLIFRPPSFDSYRAIDFIALLIMILLTISLHVSNVKALQYLEVSVFSVIYNLRILIASVLGILFLNEELVWTRLFGGILILVAILIVRQKGSKLVRIRGIEWAIIAAFVMSFSNLTEKLMIKSVGILNYFPLVMVVVAIIMWFYLLTRKQKIDKTILLQSRMIRLMTFRAVSAYGFSGSLAAGALISVANYVSGMSVILIVILGALLLGERDYLGRKIAATMVAVTGLTIVLLSHLL